MAQEAEPDSGYGSGGGVEPEFGVGKSILFSMVLLLSLVAVMEGGIRVWVYFFRDAYERFDRASNTFELVPGAYDDGLRVNPDGFVGADLQPDAPDLFRIYALGDSCTFGGGSEKFTYPAILGRQLAEVDGLGQRYEVVNAGVQGLNSELALNRLKVMGPLVGPEVVTIYIGWNDLMKFDPAAQGTSSRFAAVAQALDGLWLVKGLRKLLFFYLRPRLFPPRTGPESRTGRFRDFQPAIFEQNLRAILAEVRRLGAKPLLATLPTVVREEMTADDLQQAHVVFPYFPAGNAVGDFLDLLGAYNRTIRRVAAEEQVPIVDLARTFQELPDVRPYFYDTMHMTSAGREIVARELETGLAGVGLLALPARTVDEAPSAADK